MYSFRPFVLLAISAVSVHGAVLVTSEGFDDISLLPGRGWVLENASTPPGMTDWFQGNPGIFPSHSGDAESYIAANFLNADFGGDIENWLYTPAFLFENGNSVSFWTRTQSAPAVAPDRLRLWFSDSGGSEDMSDFELVLSINEGLTPTGYPADWTQYTYSLSGLPGIVSGRFAFVYSVPDTDVNADYIGIDDVVIASYIPECSTGLMAASALGLLAGIRRLRRRFSSSGTIAGAVVASMLAAGSPSAAEEAKTAAKGGPEAVQVTVVQKSDVSKSSARPASGRIYVREGTQPVAAARVAAAPVPQKSGDAVVLKLPSGGSAARLGPAYLSKIHATKRADGSVVVEHKSRNDGSKMAEERRNDR